MYEYEAKKASFALQKIPYNNGTYPSKNMQTSYVFKTFLATYSFVVLADRSSGTLVMLLPEHVTMTSTDVNFTVHAPQPCPHPTTVANVKSFSVTV